MFDVVYSYLFSASVHLWITNEQEAFICRVIDIPFNECRCKDLIALNTLHAYCGGPEPMHAARRLNTYSRQRKFLLLGFFFHLLHTYVCLSNVRLLSFAEIEAAGQRVLVRVSTATRKQNEGASTSAPKVVTKGTSK